MQYTNSYNGLTFELLIIFISVQENRPETPAPPVQSNVVSDIMATPKKLLRAWEGRSADMQKLDEELMSTKIREGVALTELKELRLKVCLS